MDMIDCVFLFEEYSDRLVYGEEHPDEALQNAVDWVWRSKSDEFRSDLCCRIQEVWDRTQIPQRFGATLEVQA